MGKVDTLIMAVSIVCGNEWRGNTRRPSAITGRMIFVHLCGKHCGLTQKQIATYVNRSRSDVARMQAMFSRNAERGTVLAIMMEAAENEYKRRNK